MTVITADLKDSIGQPLDGYIQIKLDYLVSDDSATYLPAANRIVLADGQATILLEPSEVARVTYLFEVYQTTATTDGSVDTLLWAFRAKVPASVTPIRLTDLIQTTGITNDALDSSLTAIIRRLYLSQDFWQELQGHLLKPQGFYSPTAWYKRGDLVNYQGDAYLYIAALAAQGSVPTDASAWHLLTEKGQTGAGTTGNPAPYDAMGWVGATDAPSKGAIRNIIEQLARSSELATKAPLVGASLTSPTLAADPPASDRTSKLVSAQWVQAIADEIRKALVPVGAISAFAGTSAPAGWVLCDGRTLDRTAYAALFALLGTAYNVGGEAATVFRVPDLRGRVVMGMDSMSALRGAANRVVDGWATTLGGAGGAATVTLTEAQLPPHQHNLAYSFLGVNNAGAFVSEIPGIASGSFFTGGVGRPSSQLVSGDTGSGQAHSNLQPSLALNAIIYTGG